jgi:hypothetical protein
VAVFFPAMRRPKAEPASFRVTNDRAVERTPDNVMRQKLETAIRPREAFPRRALAFLMALAAVLTAAFAFRGLVEPTGVAAATAAARALVAAHPLFPRSALRFSTRPSRRSRFPSSG